MSQHSQNHNPLILHESDVNHGSTVDDSACLKSIADACRSDLAQKQPQETNTTEAKKVKSIPRKPISGYFLFNEENRAKVRANHQGASAATIVKIMSQTWRKLTEDEKDVYNKKSARIKQEYLDYMKEHGLVVGRKRTFDQTVANAKNDKDIPPKPLSAYFLFNKEHRAKVREDHAGEPAPTIVKVLSQMWKALTEEEKKIYQEKAACMKQEYQDYMKKHGLTKKKNPNQTIGEMVKSLPTIQQYTNHKTLLPINQLKKIMRLNDEFNRSTPEANILIAKATECFISWLAQSAFRVNAIRKKKTIMDDSFYQALARDDRMEWLRASMPAPKNSKMFKSPRKSPQKRSKISKISNPKITSLFQSS